MSLLSFSGRLKWQLSIKLDIRNLFPTVRIGSKDIAAWRTCQVGGFWLWVRQTLAKCDGVSRGWACLGARRWIEWACQGRKQELSDFAQCPSTSALSTLSVDYHIVCCFPKRLSIIQITCAAFLHIFLSRKWCCLQATLAWNLGYMYVLWLLLLKTP